MVKHCKISKFLSFVLRHNPHVIGMDLDNEGWASVDELIEGAHKIGKKIYHDQIKQIVANNDKQRFSLSDDGKRIKANQGHSIKVDLELTEKEPPHFLYHGTARKFMTSIRKQGVTPSGRHHVHLSVDYETAKDVGRRHGVPVVLQVLAQEMWFDREKFYLSANNIWLTNKVAPKYFLVMNL